MLSLLCAASASVTLTLHTFAGPDGDDSFALRQLALDVLRASDEGFVGLENPRLAFDRSDQATLTLRAAARDLTCRKVRSWVGCGVRVSWDAVNPEGEVVFTWVSSGTGEGSGRGEAVEEAVVDATHALTEADAFDDLLLGRPRLAVPEPEVLRPTPPARGRDFATRALAQIEARRVDRGGRIDTRRPDPGTYTVRRAITIAYVEGDPAVEGELAVEATFERDQRADATSSSRLLESRVTGSVDHPLALPTWSVALEQEVDWEGSELVAQVPMETAARRICEIFGPLVSPARLGEIARDVGQHGHRALESWNELEQGRLVDKLLLPVEPLMAELDEGWTRFESVEAACAYGGGRCRRVDVSPIPRDGIAIHTRFLLDGKGRIQDAERNVVLATPERRIERTETWSIRPAD